MKKSIAVVAMAFGVTSAFAQDLTDKKGRLIMPEAKDWSISVDATPFIDFAADLVHIGAAGTKGSPNFTSLNGSNYSLTGKYFKNSTTAYRAIVSLNNTKNTDVQFLNKLSTAAVAQTWPNTLNPDQVKDVQRTRDWHVGLGAGIEKRKGTKYRLQGYYGADASIILAGGGESYKYGNDVVANAVATSVNDDDLTKYTHNFGANVSTAASHDERTLSVRNGKTIAIGVRGFVGVEYFFASKMSIGGEFGWGLGWSRTGRGRTTIEGLDRQADDGTTFAAGSEVVVGKTKEKTGSVAREFFVGNQRDNSTTGGPTKLWMNSFSPAGKLSLNFYF